MSVLLETSKGDIVIDLHVDKCPVSCKNFLKLCKIKYYNDVLWHRVTKDFVVQTGDPTGSGSGGTSIFGALLGNTHRFFGDEINPTLKHAKKGTVSYVPGGGENANASQFLITTRDSCDALDGKHTVFGMVTEGLEVLSEINEAYCDKEGRPFQNIRIKHTLVLDDPFEDMEGLDNLIPPQSPTFKKYPHDLRLEDDWRPSDTNTEITEQQAEINTRAKEAKNRAVVLEMIGDLPQADATPPPESLFVCKLNPITSDEDLEIIFSRFGEIKSCDVVRDHKTGDSLCFAFITFTNKQSAERAFFKMDNVLIDDRRVKVDFSQSMHGLWRNFKQFGKSGGTAADANLAGAAGSGGGGNGNNSQGRPGGNSFCTGDGRRVLEIKGGGMARASGLSYDSNNGGRGGGPPHVRGNETAGRGRVWGGRPHGDRDDRRRDKYRGDRRDDHKSDRRDDHRDDRDRDRHRRSRSRSRDRGDDRDKRDGRDRSRSPKAKKENKHKRERSCSRSGSRSRSRDRKERKDKKHKKQRDHRSRSKSRSVDRKRGDLDRHTKRRDRSRSRERDGRDRTGQRRNDDQKQTENVRDADGVIKRSAGGLEVRKKGGTETRGEAPKRRQDDDMGPPGAYDF